MDVELEVGGASTKRILAEATKEALQRNDSPLRWAASVAKLLQKQQEEAGIAFCVPSLDLGYTLVAYICSGSLSVPRLLWNYLGHAMTSGLVSSLHILGLLLSSRLIHDRFLHPKVYLSCLEVMEKYISCIGSTKIMPCHEKIVKAVDMALQLSQSSRLSAIDLGTVVVHFILVFVWKLVDAAFEDCSIYLGRSENRDYVFQYQSLLDANMEPSQAMNVKEAVDSQQLCKMNTIKALDIVMKIMQHKMTRSLLRLAQQNLLNQWSVFTHCLCSLEELIAGTGSGALDGVGDALSHVIGSMHEFYHVDAKQSHLPIFQSLSGSHRNSIGNREKVESWVSIDLLMEDALDGRRVPASSMACSLASMAKSLQVIQNVSWHETFLALWISALRLVQREQIFMDSPRPMSELRFCILLAIVPIASALLIEEEEKRSTDDPLKLDGSHVPGGNKGEAKSFANRRVAFASSVQTLGQFEGLLSPNQHSNAAVQAVGAAAAYIAGFNGGNVPIEAYGAGDRNALRTVASLHHLIVETCIARGLLDTSAYYWPGYLGGLTGIVPLSASSQGSPWNMLMVGAPLTGSLKNSLMSTPARSLAEVKKIYEVAVDGSDDERPPAASVLCGASFIHGWNVQEHVVEHVLRLLSPVPPPEASRNTHYLVPHAPVFHVVLSNICTSESLHILSLFGMIPQLAAALLPICEIYGSLSPSITFTAGSGEEISVLSLFSLAFLVLVKLWRFHHPAVEHRLLSAGSPLGSDLGLDYLLKRYNLQASSNRRQIFFDKVDDQKLMSSHITLDSFVKLKAWYIQHQSCITSPLSGLVCGGSLRQIVDNVLTMILKKACKGPGAANVSGTNSPGDDVDSKLMLPAWELLTAVPFVVDAMLTACDQGQLSPRDLTKGLKDFVDFFPAALAGIMSYLTAEVTRGLWKPVPMNGKDWPSPSGNLPFIEAQLQNMLAAKLITIPNFVPVSGDATVTLPLPLAALVSLTITFKVEKTNELIIAFSGIALQAAATGTPWPGMLVVAALWCQKVPRWHDNIVFGASQTLFKQDKSAVVQLLQSCFTFFSGTSPLLLRLCVHGGVGALLGHGNWTNAVPCWRYPVPPGIHFLRICPCLHNTLFLSEEILALLVNSIHELDGGSRSGQKSGSRLRSSQPSLVGMLSKIIQVSSLAASLLFISGGTTLIQFLYQETLPTWFLSGQKCKVKSEGVNYGVSALLEGYGIAYFTILSGAFAWGVSNYQECSERTHAIDMQMAFLANVLDGNMFLACEPSLWKAYVCGLMSLVVVTDWILDVQVDVLKRIAFGLHRWHECDLASALLERRGLAAMSVAAELVLVTR